MATALRKNRIPGPVLGLLLVIAAGLGLYFALLAPKAPAELPELGAFSGAVPLRPGPQIPRQKGACADTAAARLTAFIIQCGAPVFKRFPRKSCFL